MASGVYQRTEEMKRKISEGAKRAGTGKWMLGKKRTLKTRKKQSISISRAFKKPEIRAKFLYLRDQTDVKILKELDALEKQGFKCVPILASVIPDIIAVKDNQFYAIEVEYGKPRYEKYNKKDYKKFFKEVIWLLRGKNHETDTESTAGATV